MARGLPRPQAPLRLHRRVGGRSLLRDWRVEDRRASHGGGGCADVHELDGFVRRGGACLVEKPCGSRRRMRYSSVCSRGVYLRSHESRG